MLRTSNRKVTTALLCAASVLCLSGAALALDRTVKVEADDASYGYNVKFYEDFNDGQLKEGWQYVSGKISDNAVTWGNGSKAENGKMLYNVGSKEYIVSVKMTLDGAVIEEESTDTETNETTTTYSVTSGLNFNMPIAVTNACYDKNGDEITANSRIGNGISINFGTSAIKLYNWNEGSSLTYLESTSALLMYYKNMPGYTDVTWLEEEHTWTAVVGDTYIECYVDGSFLGRAATPDYIKEADALFCGIGGTSAQASNYVKITYDDFTVWTKDKANTATTSLYDFSNIVEGKTVTAEGDTDGTPLVSATPTSQGTKIVLDSTVITEGDGSGKSYKKNTHWLGTDTFGDFTMTINVSANTMLSGGGIYFGASETDGKVSGYRFALGNGDTTYRLYTITDETDSANRTSLLMGGSDAAKYGYDKNYSVVLSVKDKTISLTYVNKSSGETVTDTKTVDNTISGYIGLRLQDTNNAKAYSSTFTMAVSTLSTEDTSVMTKATLTSTNDTKYVYSVRKNSTLTLDDLALDTVAFVNDDKSLTAELSVGEEAVAGKVLTVNSFAVEGAAIRVIGSAGIRFKTAISKADVTALQSYDEITIEEVGTILLPSELLATSGGVLTNTTEKVVTATVSVVHEVSETDMYKYWGTLTGIPDTDYATEISACGYMKITLTLDGEKVTRYVYTDVLARSLAGVAQAALDDANGGYSDEQRAQLEIYAAGNKAAE